MKLVNKIDAWIFLQSMGAASMQLDIKIYIMEAVGFRIIQSIGSPQVRRTKNRWFVLTLLSEIARLSKAVDEEDNRVFSSG